MKYVYSHSSLVRWCGFACALGFLLFSGKIVKAEEIIWYGSANAQNANVRYNEFRYIYSSSTAYFPSGYSIPFGKYPGTTMTYPVDVEIFSCVSTSPTSTCVSLDYFQLHNEDLPWLFSSTGTTWTNVSTTQPTALVTTDQVIQISIGTHALDSGKYTYLRNNSSANLGMRWCAFTTSWSCVGDGGGVGRIWGTPYTGPEEYASGTSIFDPYVSSTYGFTDQDFGWFGNAMADVLKWLFTGALQDVADWMEAQLLLAQYRVPQGYITRWMDGFDEAVEAGYNAGVVEDLEIEIAYPTGTTSSYAIVSVESTNMLQDSRYLSIYLFEIITILWMIRRAIDLTDSLQV